MRPRCRVYSQRVTPSHGDVQSRTHRSPMYVQNGRRVLDEHVDVQVRSHLLQNAAQSRDGVEEVAGLATYPCPAAMSTEGG